MGFTHRAFVAAAVGFAASALAGCGSNGRLLSQSQSSRLNAQLNTVSQALNDGDCHSAESALTAFEGKLAALNGVNSTLVANLNQGASTIQQLTSAKCAAYAQTKPKRQKTTTNAKTTTATQTTRSDTTTTNTYTNTYTQPTYSTPSTSTTGGTSPTGTNTDTTGTNTIPSTNTSPNGGQGLGAGGTTTTTYGGDNGYGNGGIPGNGGGN